MVPCDPTGKSSACCDQSDFCLSNGRCTDTGTDRAFTIQGFTDQTWPSCSTHGCLRMPESSAHIQVLRLTRLLIGRCRFLLASVTTSYVYLEHCLGSFGSTGSDGFCCTNKAFLTECGDTGRVPSFPVASVINEATPIASPSP